MRITLETRGYKVLEAKDGQEALSICERYEGPIGLIVTDLMMPRVTGLQLKEKAVALHPETKFLLISGYPDDSANKMGDLGGNTDFLEKPFLPDALVLKVRELLDPVAGEQKPGIRPEGSRDVGT